MNTLIKETNDITQGYYNELTNFIKASKEAVENKSANFLPASDILRKTELHYCHVIDELEKITNQKFDEAGMGAKIIEGLSKATANITSFFSGIGKHEDSKVLRDNYTALQASSCGFQMLYTTEVSGYGETAYSEKLLNLINSHHELIMEYAEVIPRTVAHELVLEDEAIFDAFHNEIIIDKLKSTWN
ncbi:MAG: hypothetical protein ACSHX0_03315 [Akkermansiaceae bacterium]